MSASSLTRIASWALLTLMVAALVTAGAWRLTGGRWERVETPSMGTVAPVGTLLWVEPTHFSNLQVGDFITFHPPGQAGTTYSHRVYKKYADGTISTKGVIPGPDPWRLSSHDVVGKVVMRWWGIGWLVAAAPVLIICGLLLWLLVTRFTPQRWKLPVCIVGVSLALSLAIVIYRPLTNAEQLSFAPAKTGGARAQYVSTGLLPIRLQAINGPQHVDLRTGQVGAVHSTNPDKHGRYGISIHPHIPFLFWILLVLGCFTPAAWTLLFGLPAERAAGHRLS